LNESEKEEELIEEDVSIQEEHYVDGQDLEDLGHADLNENL